MDIEPAAARGGSRPCRPPPTYANGQALDDIDQHLAKADRTIRGLIARLGPVDLQIPDAGGDRLGALILAIVSQQLSTRVARAIYGRLLDWFGGRVPTAAQLLATDQDQLRTAVGLSHAKSRALQSLAEHVEDGRLALTRLPKVRDDEVRAQLMAVTGVGAWTTDVFLMFNLRRSDILAAGDLGLRKAVQTQYQLDALPDTATVTRLAEPWRPGLLHPGLLLPVAKHGNRTRPDLTGQPRSVRSQPAHHCHGSPSP